MRLGPFAISNGSNVPALSRGTSRVIGPIPVCTSLIVPCGNHLCCGPTYRIAGPFGQAGDAPIVASRLLDARPLRQFLVRHPGDDLALAVSRSLFRDVVRTGFCCLDPVAFDPVRITVKGIAYHGYLHRTASGGQAVSSPGRAVVQIRATHASSGGQPAGRHALA